MRLMSPGIVLVAVTLGVVEFAAQAKPDFSGVWVAVGAKVNPELTVKHTSATLAMDGGPTNKGTIRLDGSVTKIIAPDGKPLLARAAWEGNTLVVTIHHPEIKQDIRRQTWAIDGGGQLVVETTIMGGGAKPRPPVKEIYKRR